ISPFFCQLSSVDESGGGGMLRKYTVAAILGRMKSQFSKIIMLDMLGYGFSDKPLDHDYLITEQADIHEALLTFNNKESKFQLESMCMLNGGVFPETNTPLIGQKLLLTPVLGSVLSHFTFYRMFERRLIKYLNQRAENKDRWVGALLETKLPVHMIYGPSDPVNSGYAFVDHYKKVVPSPSITVLDAAIGHYPQWEDPNGVFESYKSFLQSIKKP
ncbi:MEST-like protein, partial [Mya arenaria]